MKTAIRLGSGWNAWQERRPVAAFRASTGTPLKVSTVAKHRVLHVINNLDIGGAQVYVLRLCNSLDKHEFDVAVAYANENRLAGAFDHEVKLFRIPLESTGLTRHVWNSLTTVRILYQLIKRQKVHVVHTHLMSSALWAWLAARLAGVPTIYNIMGVMEPRRRLEWLASKNRLVSKVLDSLVTTYIAFSDYIYTEYLTRRGIPANKVRLNYLGVDLDRFNRERRCISLTREFGFAQDSPVAVVVARLSPEKGVDRAIRAFVDVCREISDARLLIVGDGPIRSDIEALVSSLSLKKNIVLAGARRDVPGLLQLADVYLQVGDKPNLGISTLEAMAMAKPVVTLARNAAEKVMASETCVNGMNGYVVSDEGEMARMILYLFKNPQVSLRMGQASRELAERLFDMRRHVQSVVELYQELAGRRMRRRV